MRLPVTFWITIHTFTWTVRRYCKFPNRAKWKVSVISISIIVNLKHETFKPVIWILGFYRYIFGSKNRIIFILTACLDLKFNSTNYLIFHKYKRTNLSKKLRYKYTGPPKPLSTFRLLLFGSAPWLRRLGAIEEHTESGAPLE